jgi:hypothetical protein
VRGGGGEGHRHQGGEEREDQHENGAAGHSGSFHRLPGNLGGPPGAVLLDG